MRRISTPNRAINLFGAGKHGFKSGIPGTSDRPTELEAPWANAIQEELGGFVEREGFELDDEDNGQLAKAVDAAMDRRLRRLGSFGDLVADGVADDAEVFQAAAASGEKFIDARGVHCFLGGAQIDIPNNQIWLLEGARLDITGSTGTLFNCDNKTGWGLIGPFEIRGDGTTVGTKRAIRVIDCNYWRIESPIIKTVRGWGVYLEPGGSLTARADHGEIVNLRAHQCYIGYEDVAGSGTEYCTIKNVRITGCTSWGAITSAGNMIWMGGSIVDNANGVRVVGGSNHAHGMFSGVNINHNTGKNIHLLNVTNGENFVGCHCYGDSTLTGIIHLENSQGFSFLEGHLDASIACDGAVGYHRVAGNFCPDSPAAQVHGGTTPSRVIYRENFTPAGPWHLNDPGGDLYVRAVRTGTQAVADAPATTTLVHNSEIKDTRAAYEPVTGRFTAPWKGLFAVGWCGRVTGAGMVNGYAFIYQNATPVAVAPLVAFSSTTAVCHLTANIECNLGDVIEVRINPQTGSSGMNYDATGSLFTVAAGP